MSKNKTVTFFVDGYHDYGFKMILQKNPHKFDDDLIQFMFYCAVNDSVFKEGFITLKCSKSRFYLYGQTKHILSAPDYVWMAANEIRSDFPKDWYICDYVSHCALGNDAYGNPLRR